MEALAAFGLACGVIQVVDFSTKVVAKCQELYRDGVSSENKEIESMAKHLTDLSTDLKLPNAIQSPGSVPHLYHDDQDLLELAQKCSETATELVGEVQKLCIHGPRKKREALRKTVNAFRKKDAIGNIQRRLEEYRSTLNTRILINLSQRLHLMSKEQSDNFRDLDGKLQNFITGLARHQHTFDELKGLIQAQDVSSQQHVSQEFEKHREQLTADESYKRILESLYFPDIHARQEGIAEAHRQTFEWIFDKSGSQMRPWHDFIEWLEGGHGSYWISGKAGSGKSTLMNLICEDYRTKEALRVWSGTNEIFMPKFFFWSPGTQLQKSLTGLLRSLIYQIMESFPDLMPVFTSTIGPVQHRLQQLPTWTERRLRTTLQHLLSDGQEAYRLCIFIDGLDEFHGNQDELLDLIKDLRGTTRVKFCLSSRPYQSFSDEFGSSAMLKLQDLTEPDIRRYVSDKLDRALLNVPQAPCPSYGLKHPVDQIIQKASGVFLWVKLAVRDQLEGIRNGDDAVQLRERLETLPEEIEGLYGHMLRGIDKVYSKEVALYLQLRLHRPDFSLFKLALAVHKRIDDILLFSPDISISDIPNHCEHTRKRIATTCKGFLEVQERLDFNEWQKLVTVSSDDDDDDEIFLQSARAFSKSLQDRNIPLEQRDPLIENKYFDECVAVKFLHRTAFDFFTANVHGKGFLEANTSANQNPQVICVKANLAGLTILPVSTDDSKVSRYIRGIMMQAIVAENTTGVAQVALMDLLDRSVAMLCQRCKGHLTEFHWCKAWGSEPNLAVDFLGFAAWTGLHRYVDHKIDLRSECRNRSTAGYLLSCAMEGLTTSHAFDRDSSLKLMSALLKRGADPNLETSKGTVWGDFLQEMHKTCHERPYFQGMQWKYGQWENTMRTFFESGANVTERKCYALALIFSEEAKARVVNSTRFKLGGISIRLELSVLSTVKQCFANRPEYLELQDAMIASGASSYSECTEIKIGTNDGGRCRWLDPKLSKEQKEQLRQISPILDQRLCALTGDPKQKQVWEDQSEELYQALDIEKLIEQARQEEEAKVWENGTDYDA